MIAVSLLLAGLLMADTTAQLPKIQPAVRWVDLDVGQSASVAMSDGTHATVRLVAIDERRDSVRQAVREARVTVEVNGRRATLVSANYRLPETVGSVQIDCPVTRGCIQPARKQYANLWALDKDARLRLWPAGAKWIEPGTFRYPVVQRWFATSTQMANEPTYVDGGERPSNSNEVYYHWGLDIGGSEGQVEVVAAVDAVVVTAGPKTLDPPEMPDVVRKRNDVVYLRDGRGWYYRYSHMITIDPAIVPGRRVTMGQRIGLLGKEGPSGGWTHLHFDITALQPSGRWGIVESYAFLWQAYHDAEKTQLQAVARPHHLTWIGQPVTLDGSRSWSREGGIARFDWQLSDGTTAQGATAERRYDRVGTYSEILKVTDRAGRIDYDFAQVQVLDPKNPDHLTPSIHAVYWPTLGLKAGQPITFKVRSFRVRPDEGRERWDFGDGTAAVEVRSDGCVKASAKDGYAVTTHAYARAGHYLVSVRRTNDRGETALAHLHVRVE